MVFSCRVTFIGFTMESVKFRRTTTRHWLYNLIDYNHYRYTCAVQIFLLTTILHDDTVYFDDYDSALIATGHAHIN